MQPLAALPDPIIRSTIILHFPHCKIALLFACYYVNAFIAVTSLWPYMSALWFVKDLQSQCRVYLKFVIFNKLRGYHFSPLWVFVPAELQRIGKKLSLNMKMLAKSPGNVHFRNSIAQFHFRIWYCTFKDAIIKTNVLSILFPLYGE